MIHENSLSAFRSLNAAARTAEIFAVYRDSMVPLTDREVMASLDFHDANMVRPRITELIKAGKLVEVQNVKDQTTGKTVRCCTNRVMA